MIAWHFHHTISSDKYQIFLICGRTLGHWDSQLARRKRERERERERARFKTKAVTEWDTGGGHTGDKTE